MIFLTGRFFCGGLSYTLGFPGGSVVTNVPAMQELQVTRVQFLGGEDPLEDGMATHSSILAWRMLWTEEPGRVQSTGSQSRTWLKWLSTHTGPIHCRMFSSTPDIYYLIPVAATPPVLNCDNKKMSSDNANIPWEPKSLAVGNYGFIWPLERSLCFWSRPFFELTTTFLSL